MSVLLCPACRHPTRKHDSLGCTIDNGSCFCLETRATLAADLDELVSVAAPGPVELPPPPQALVRAAPVAQRGRRREFTEAETVENKLKVSLHDRQTELSTILRKLRGRDPKPHELNRIAELREQIHALRTSGEEFVAAPEDSPACADGGVVARRPEHDLPGTDPAPIPVGAVAADPPAGQLLHQGRTWWCPRCLQGRELPSARCCRTRLIPADVIVRRRVPDG